MGGDITVISHPGQGSVFTVAVPLKLDSVLRQPGAVTPLPLPAAPVAKPGEVLVVEDYAANVMVVTMMLENLGYTADVANNGAEALRKIAGRTQPYRAILMDVQMQDMDGYETTRRLRVLEQEKGFHHFVIGVTAHALAGDREKCLAAGMDDYMSKPINLDVLDQKLRQPKQAA